MTEHYTISSLKKELFVKMTSAKGVCLLIKVWLAMIDFP